MSALEKFVIIPHSTNCANWLNISSTISHCLAFIFSLKYVLNKLGGLYDGLTDPVSCVFFFLEIMFKKLGVV